MKKLGTVKDYNDIKSKCFVADYNEITMPYCQNASTPGKWQVALYDDKGNYKSTGCAQSGCDDHACPVVQYGTCVIKDYDTSTPGYGAADSGKGYVMRKMGTVKDYNDIKSKCFVADYQELAWLYCQNNTGPGQWQVALYDSNGNSKTIGCAQNSCGSHACPVK